LCKTLHWRPRVKGFRATEELVFYRFFYIEREIHFPVRECSFYEDRRLASKEDMEEIAWILNTIKPTASAKLQQNTLDISPFVRLSFSW